MRRRASLVTLLALAGAAAPPTRLGAVRPQVVPPGGVPRAQLDPPDLPWRLLRRRIEAGGPNGRLGLVQAQHIFGRVGTAYSRGLLQGGLMRVRIPASLVRQGEDGWRHDRFPDAWWMDILHRLRVPFKAVVELWPRFSAEQNAEHAARVVRRARPEVVIIGNELNMHDRGPGVERAAEIERYLDSYETMHAAIRAEALETRVQLYGEAYDGQPSDPDAFLRQMLAAMRRRGTPPPDAAGLHVYDRADVLPERVAGYRRLLADFGLQVPLSVEELGLRQGVIERWEEARLAALPSEDPAHANRLDELRAAGWVNEAEQEALVAQHLATAAACADQAQVFCAVDFDAEIDRRRGLVSHPWSRARPALDAFQFLQRLLNNLETARLRPAAEHGENAGITQVSATRRDGLAAEVYWSAPMGAGMPVAERTIVVPPYTFVCDARGQLVQPPQAQPTTLTLPAATTPEAGGAVRILL
jgi:hypothetical protein